MFQICIEVVFIHVYVMLLWCEISFPLLGCVSTENPETPEHSRLRMLGSGMLCPFLTVYMVSWQSECLFCVSLGIKPGASYMMGKHFTTELEPLSSLQTLLLRHCHTKLPRLASNSLQPRMTLNWGAFHCSLSSNKDYRPAAPDTATKNILMNLISSQI